MPKRLIDTTASELSRYSKSELLTAIAESEGRTLAAETIGTVTPMLVNITNAEFVASLGTDLIMLNIFDVNNPMIQGLPQVAVEATIRQIALMCKMAGADIHHIGDSGYMGMALPENITAYSVAIRGKRHTYRRMAMSLLR